MISRSITVSLLHATILRLGDMRLGLVTLSKVMLWNRGKKARGSAVSRLNSFLSRYAIQHVWNAHLGSVASSLAGMHGVTHTTVI
jgi:hypothetical protein